jgi:predicted ATPase/class 3 adenylate cyclase
MAGNRQQLEAGIQAFEAQRALLGDAVVDLAVAPLKEQLSLLLGTAPAAPAAGAEPTQSLRQVSILFLDVVGSTSLAQILDPEDVSAVMDDALQRGTALVAQYRGKVLQYAGDNILAAFGADESREDDAERAVHCGLALLTLGQTLGEEVLARHGHAGLDVRVGVHTGGVLLGGGVDAEGSIRGSAVNMAARMEQTAPAGHLRISHDTYAQVRGLFEVQPQEPLAVKGVDAPVLSYLVLHAQPRPARFGMRGIEGVPTNMIGRDVELEALQTAYKRLFEQRQLAAVTVVAEAGIGKSRLVCEFEAWCRGRPETWVLFRGRATPQTGTQAFGLLRDIIATHLQINDDDSVPAARRKMEQGMVPLFVQDDGLELAQGHAHLLGHLIGIEWRESHHLVGILDDPKQIRNRAFHAAAQLFRRVISTEGSPVILQLEDLHWADGESLDFLSYLAEVNRDLPMFVLACARPSLFEQRTGWPPGDGNAGNLTEGMHQRIDLHALDKTGSRMLANELLKNLAEIPASLRDLLTSSAEGNPFYMEELVKMLIDQGAILAQPGPGQPWRVDTHKLLVAHVPPTLTGVLQARLDSLTVDEKHALQLASVVGAVFWDQALAAVETRAAEQLAALVQRELTLPRTEAPLDGLREYAFCNQVLHQVTYDTVLKRHKREGHARVAQWLAGLSAQGSLRAGDFLGLAAKHFELAGDAADAAEYHARAAEQAGPRFAHDRVLAHVGRALALLDEAPAAPQAALRWRLLLAREKSLYLQARRDEQAADLDALTQLADQLNDDRCRAEVARRRAYRAARMTDWAEQGRAARHAMACAERAGDHSLHLDALRMLAVAQVMQGEIQAGRALALQGLEQATRLGLRAVEGKLLNTLAIAAERLGDLVGALEFDRQTLLINREIGDRVNEAIGRLNLGEGWMKLGDLPQARRDLDVALHMLRANGDRAIEGAALSNLSVLALWQGEETRALVLARSALEIALAAQAREEAVLAGVRWGDAELALGLTAPARQAYEQALVHAVQTDSTHQHDANAGLARVALAEGDTALARAALQPILDWVVAGGTLDGTEFPRLIEWTCYQVLTGAKDPHAADWLARAHAALMAQAQTIMDAGVRQGFLHHIPYHREIVAARVSRIDTGVAATDRRS